MSLNTEEVQRTCHEKAFHAYATAYLYSRRSRAKDTGLSLITFLGIIIPVTIGGMVVAYGLKSAISDVTLTIVTPFAVAQLILSTLAIVYKWDDKKSTYVASSISNRQLYAELTSLARFPPQDIVELTRRYELLDLRLQIQDEQDEKYPLSDKELRRGMRYALRQYQKNCSGCGETPLSMKSSNCNICGNFKLTDI